MEPRVSRRCFIVDRPRGSVAFRDGGAVLESLSEFSGIVRGRFNLVSVLGRGGNATVFRALDRQHRWVAVKIFDATTLHYHTAVRFLHEIARASHLRHAHVLPVVDWGRTGSILYFVTPLIDGPSLAKRLANQGRLSETEAITIAAQAAEGLACAHDQGMAHLGLKPRNVLLSQDRAVVSDFGVAASMDGDVSAAVTPEYMSPEQVTGFDTVDARADVYSLGCMLFEMLTGEVPFRGTSAALVLSQHLNTEPPSARTAGANVQPELDRVLIRALAKNPQDRFANARQFAMALDTCCAPPSAPERASEVM